MPYAVLSYFSRYLTFTIVNSYSKEESRIRRPYVKYLETIRQFDIDISMMLSICLELDYTIYQTVSSLDAVN